MSPVYGLPDFFRETSGAFGAIGAPNPASGGRAAQASGGRRRAAGPDRWSGPGRL